MENGSVCGYCDRYDNGVNFVMDLSQWLFSNILTIAFTVFGFLWFVFHLVVKQLIRKAIKEYMEKHIEPMKAKVEELDKSHAVEKQRVADHIKQCEERYGHH